MGEQCVTPKASVWSSHLSCNTPAAGAAMILAMATLISTVFHFGNNVINISLIFIVALYLSHAPDKLLLTVIESWHPLRRFSG